MPTVEVVRVGEELGVVLPPETLKRLNLKDGDTVYITVRPNSIYLSPIPPPDE